MKKLLSFVLVAMMVLSCIAPCFASNGEKVVPYSKTGYLPSLPDGTPEDANGVAWIEDAAIDPETNTVELKLYIKAPEDGYHSYDLALYYPDCLEMIDCTYGDDADASCFEQGKMNETTVKGITLYPFDWPANTELMKKYGLKYDDVYGKNYPADSEDLVRTLQNYYAHPMILSPNENYDISYQGNLETMTFKYIPEKNTYGDRIPVLLMYDKLVQGEGNLFISIEDVGADGFSAYRENSYVSPVSFVTIPSDTECTHEADEPIVVPATCTSEGSSKTYCKLCGELIEDKILPMTAHQSVKTCLVAPTSTTEGSWRYYCTVCSSYTGEVYTIPKTDKFNLSIESVTSAPGEEVTIPVSISLPETGFWGTVLYGVWEKTLGGDETVSFTNGNLVPEFSSNEAKEITSWDEEEFFDYYNIDFGYDINDYYKNCLFIIPAESEDIENSYGDGVLYYMHIKAPEEVGEYRYGYILIDEMIGVMWDNDSEGSAEDIYIYDTDSRIAWATLTVAESTHKHTPGDATVVPATCKTEGSSTVYCTECGEIISCEIIEKLPHTAGNTVRKEPDCTKAGYVTTYCSVCNSAISVETLSPVGHHYGKRVTLQPTSEKEGAWRYYCYKCGQYTDDEVYTLSKLDKLEMSITDATAEPGETITIPVNAKLPSTGLWGTIVFAVWDKDLGTDVAFANGDLMREFEAAEAANITDYTVKHYFDYYDIDFGEDVADYYKSTLSCYPTGEDQSNVYGEGILYTMTVTAPAEPGTYKLGYVIVDDILGNIWDDDSAAYTYDVDSRIEWITLTVAEKVHIHTPGEAVVVPATCTEAGSKTVPCTICDEVITTEILPAAGHVPGEWKTVKEATVYETGLKELRCTVCGALIDSAVIPVLTEKTLDLGIEPGYFSDKTQTAIDNETRTITLVSKINALENDYRLILPDYSYTVTTTDRNVKVIGDEHFCYLRSYASTGSEQFYTIVVNDGEEDYEYTVNVVFVKGPACSGVEPGYFADITLTGFTPDNDHVINVVSKPGASEVDFRMTGIAAGAYPTVNEGDAMEIQRVNGDYIDVRDSIYRQNTQMTYFRSLASNGDDQVYSINVVFVDGTVETYTVVVQFIKEISD